MQFSERQNRKTILFWFPDLHHLTVLFVSSATQSLAADTKMQDQNLGFTLTSDLLPLAILIKDVTVLSKSSLCPHSPVVKQGSGHSCGCGCQGNRDIHDDLTAWLWLSLCDVFAHMKQVWATQLSGQQRKACVADSVP